MTRRHVALALALACLAGVVFLQGCAHRITDYPEQPAMVMPVARNIESVVLKVVWHDSVDAMQVACGANRAMAYGCATVRLTNPLRCELHAMVPEDFNDKPKLLILGHEITHCFLMMH